MMQAFGMENSIFRISGLVSAASFMMCGPLFIPLALFSGRHDGFCHAGGAYIDSWGL
jgi:hypothetical protein